MKAKIFNLDYDIDCPEIYENIAPLVPLKHGRVDYDHPLIKWVLVEDGEKLWRSENPVLGIDITIDCNSIQVNDDRITIEFPDGSIADYEISSDEYHYIKII
jgi:hypothetical protein